MAIPRDYAQRVYAGVLGKIIGVYLGRPFEGWSHEKILSELGEINYYVHDRRNVPLIVTDDDISGTFTFIRALEDYAHKGADIDPADIGQTWLNYIIENRTILWWGGMGNSTEHTAFLRLKQGIPAPRSGSSGLNSKVVAEQIGAQIFIDGWAMVAPGNPKLAAELARKAASVSHDGEAIYGAQVVAAIEALAFVERDIPTLIDAAVKFIPGDCVIARMIGDLRKLARRERDWKKAYAFMKANYGYDKYGGNCHMVPNHGLIILGLLWGEDSFQKSLMIANTCGWDTDCNSGNVGCIMGIKNGLEGIEAGPDWRGPVADRMYLPTADGSGCVTDALTQTYKLVNTGLHLAGKQAVHPKNAARYHFSLPGSVQGFRAEESPETRGVATVSNEGGRLQIRYEKLAPGRAARVATATFIPPEAAAMPGYSLIASPTLYAGQAVRAAIRGCRAAKPTCRLYVGVYGDNEQIQRLYGPPVALGEKEARVSWRIPDTGGQPIATVGIELAADAPASGVAHVDWLTWDGVPSITFRKTQGGGEMFKRAWVAGCSEAWFARDSFARVVQNEGTGLLMTGDRAWQDYSVRADVTPHLARSAGLALHVQGMKRYYALLLCAGGKVQLVKALDGLKILASADLAWEFGQTRRLAVSIRGGRLAASLDGKRVLEARDLDLPLTCGGIGLVCEEGRCAFGPVSVRPA